MKPFTHVVHAFVSDSDRRNIDLPLTMDSCAVWSSLVSSSSANAASGGGLHLQRPMRI